MFPGQLSRVCWYSQRQFQATRHIEEGSRSKQGNGCILTQVFNSFGYQVVCHAVMVERDLLRQGQGRSFAIRKRPCVTALQSRYLFIGEANTGMTQRPLRVSAVYPRHAQAAKLENTVFHDPRLPQAQVKCPVTACQFLAVRQNTFDTAAGCQRFNQLHFELPSPNNGLIVPPMKIATTPRGSVNSSIGTWLIFGGIALILIGVIAKTGLLSWFGHLPLDFNVKREGFQFYFPLGSMIVISVVLTVLINLIRKFF